MRRMAATLAVLLLAQGCSGPPLEPWHTEKLTEEFTVAKADEIRSFEDYRQQEVEQRLREDAPPKRRQRTVGPYGVYQMGDV